MYSLRGLKLLTALRKGIMKSLEQPHRFQDGHLPLNKPFTHLWGFFNLSCLCPHWYITRHHHHHYNKYVHQKKFRPWTSQIKSVWTLPLTRAGAHCVQFHQGSQTYPCKIVHNATTVRSGQFFVAARTLQRMQEHGRFAHKGTKFGVHVTERTPPKAVDDNHKVGSVKNPPKSKVT